MCNSWFQDETRKSDKNLDQILKAIGLFLNSEFVVITPNSSSSQERQALYHPGKIPVFKKDSGIYIGSFSYENNGQFCISSNTTRSPVFLKNISGVDKEVLDYYICIINSEDELKLSIFGKFYWHLFEYSDEYLNDYDINLYSFLNRVNNLYSKLLDS
jgi:hypothetical protein